MLDVSLLGVGMVLRFEGGAWVESLGQATNEYVPLFFSPLLTHSSGVCPASAVKFDLGLLLRFLCGIFFSRHIQVGF